AADHGRRADPGADGTAGGRRSPAAGPGTDRGQPAAARLRQVRRAETDRGPAAAMDPLARPPPAGAVPVVADRSGPHRAGRGGRRAASPDPAGRTDRLAGPAP